jgi:hypothetical protein
MTRLDVPCSLSRHLFVVLVLITLWLSSPLDAAAQPAPATWNEGLYSSTPDGTFLDGASILRKRNP